MIFSVRSLNGFGEKIVVTVIELEFVCQTSTIVIFFSKVHRCFFSLTRSLIDGCQIVTDTCKQNV